MRVAILSFLCVCALADAATAQRGAVSGRVVDADGGAALPLSAVAIDGTRLGAITDSAGRFLIDGVNPGSVTVTVRRIGYASARRSVLVRSGDTTEFVFRLQVQAVTVGAVRVEERSVERERFELEPNVGVLSVTSRARAAVPAIGERDVLRTVQLMPGVLARNDFSAGFNVRGGEGDQNLVLLDGHPIYNPFHLGGLFGTFIDEAVQDLELMTAAFPSNYGSRLSSVLDVTPAIEARSGLHGTVGVSLLASTATLGGAFPRSRGGWQVAARRTYADVLANALSDRGLPYHFRDAQVHLRHLLPGGGDAQLTVYDGRDVLDGDFAGISDTTRPGGGTFVFDWGNRVVGATVSWPLRALIAAIGGDSARVEQRASLSHFDTKLDLGDGALVLANRVRDLRAAGSLQWHAGNRRRSGGYEISAHRVHYRADSPDTDAQLYLLEQAPTSGALWYDERWRPTRRVIVQGGLRLETVTGAGWTGLSPRAAVKWFATPDLAVSVAGGRHAQWLHSLAREDVPVRIFDFWVASDAWTRVSTAEHAVLGVERWLGSSRFLRVESYYKRYHDLLEGDPTDDPSVRGDEFVPADGYSYGIDLMARQLESGPFGGWIAYSYGLAARISNGARYWPGHDRRHNLNVVGSWSVTRRWLLSARFGYATGTPYTNMIGQMVRRSYDPGRNRWDTGMPIRQIDPLGGPRNADRLPPFQRLDLSATGRYAWRGMRISPFASVVNAYNARNVFTYTFDYSANPPTRSSISQFPLLPSIGLTVGF